MIASQANNFSAYAYATACAPTEEANAQTIALGWTDLIEHRDYLVRFAKRKLQDASQAEDIVHDVFEAVITGKASFSGRSALRSWLTAVLKNKIVDVIRHSVRFDSMDACADDEEAPQVACTLPRPDELAEQRQRLYQTMKNINTLAPGLRDVMEFRVLQDESSEEVCQRLQISEASLFVRLHRARKQLLC